MSVFTDLTATFSEEVQLMRGGKYPPIQTAEQAFSMVERALRNALDDLANEVDANGKIAPWQVLSSLVSIASACEIAALDLKLTLHAEQARAAENN